MSAATLTEPRVRLNTVCPYYTMFPLSFPAGALKDAPSSARVLDPFCGRGTTLYAARMRGMYAVGVDANPVAAAIAQAKLARASAERVAARAVKLIEEHSEAASIPEGEFWEWCFHPMTLRNICALRVGLIQSRNDDVARLVRAVVLGALHGPRQRGRPSYLSNQMPRTYATKPAAAVRFWEKRAMAPPATEVLDVIDRRARYVLADQPGVAGGRVLCGDARRVLRPGERFTHIITSPPYPGMRTYLPDQWLRYWFIGGPPVPDYRLPGQIGNTAMEPFARALADVWSAVARCSAAGARLTVRFGALPSIERDPVALLALSMHYAQANWDQFDVRPAPLSARAKRQAAQFVPAGEARDEIDAEYVLRV
jgi:hypothetical protein